MLSSHEKYRTLTASVYENSISKKQTVRCLTMTTLKSNIKSYTGNKQVNDKKIQKVLFNILFHHIEELVFVMENVKKHRVFIFQDQFRLLKLKRSF